MPLPEQLPAEPPDVVLGLFGLQNGADRRRIQFVQIRQLVVEQGRGVQEHHVRPRVLVSEHRRAVNHGLNRRVQSRRFLCPVLAQKAALRLFYLPVNQCLLRLLPTGGHCDDPPCPASIPLSTMRASRTVPGRFPIRGPPSVPALATTLPLAAWPRPDTLRSARALFASGEPSPRRPRPTLRSRPMRVTIRWRLPRSAFRHRPVTRRHTPTLRARTTRPAIPFSILAKQRTDAGRILPSAGRRRQVRGQGSHLGRPTSDAPPRRPTTSALVLPLGLETKDSSSASVEPSRPPSCTRPHIRRTPSTIRNGRRSVRG